MSEGLQLRIMRGYEGGRTTLDQMPKDDTRQGRALLGICASAQLIQDHKRTRVGYLQDANDIGDMAAERAQGLLDRLLVANIRIHGREAGQLGAALHGNMQPALRHHHQQANRFERDGLAACVRAGNNQSTGAGLRVYIDGHDRCRVEQRMAGMNSA